MVYVVVGAKKINTTPLLKMNLKLREIKRPGVFVSSFKTNSISVPFCPILMLGGICWNLN